MILTTIRENHITYTMNNMEQYTELKIKNSQLKAKVKKLRWQVIFWMMVSIVLLVANIVVNII